MRQMIKKRILLLTFVTLLLSSIMCILFTITLKNDARLRQPTPIHLKIRFNYQELEKLEFNNQDLEDLLNISNSKEWIELYEKKIKSYSKYIKKILKEIEKVPAYLDEYEVSRRYEKIFKESLFIDDIDLTKLLFDESWSYAFEKEFINKYKNAISEDKELLEIFDLFLKILYLEQKISILDMGKLFRDWDTKPEFYNALQKQIDDTEQREILMNYQVRLKSMWVDYQNKHPNNKKIKLTSEEDMLALWSVSQLYKKYFNLEILFDFNSENMMIGLMDLYEDTIAKSSIIQEFLDDYGKIIKEARRKIK